MPRWVLLSALCALASLCEASVVRVEMALAAEVHQVAPSESETSDEETVVPAAGASEAQGAVAAGSRDRASRQAPADAPPTRPPRA